ncbi:uncharacterized protein Dwil_GK13966 [Drosophila willistoni]|uniref:G-protein coupled receptors family 1 profile domain-containing protein n=1 Tax=Drosophila willistoni TaxID=7260 RepID=B4NKQ6_DROWI|nr:uncharacterized protein LOC6650185 [Drosophila willistoni]EDW84117.1 uncharacterized protein Dwil_GK13966 [Drosophila willistoni]
MAIDFLILALLLISFLINLLALCAFWITPGLRTTANRFTINLLAINLIGCCILAPTLFLSGVKTLNAESSGIGLDTETIEIYSKPGNHQVTVRRHGHIVEQDGILVQKNNSANETIETLFKCKGNSCRKLTIDEHGDGGIVITEMETQEEDNNLSETVEPEILVPPVELRCWSIDMTAALGALAVLLVVGDTWCAVTDPLRYHTRISGLKTWIFIALTWAVGILFGALSAFRVLDFEADSLLSKQRLLAATYFNITSTNSIFGVVYACIYFIVIILLPFGFVCGMYWRIFSEARGNGLRMRQNGSSPLLQSALNLTGGGSGSHQAAHGNQYSNSLCVHRHSISSASSHGGGSGGGGGLQMQIDQRNIQRSSPSCLRRDSAAKVLLPTISDDGGSEASADAIQLMPPVLEHEHSLSDRNQNILLTLQTASGEIKRNYSARQLPLLGTSSQDLRETNRLQGIRQVHSSPNLHKFTEMRENSVSEECGSPNLLGHAQHQQQQHQQQQHQQNQHQNQRQQHPHFSSPRQQQQQQQLQIPAIHASPKALSYMSSLRHRLSNASSLFKYREESRAARISILVVVMFVVSYLPFGLLVLLQSRLMAANFSGSTQLAIFMILLANLSSPFIFAYRNKRVRRGVKRLFGLESSGSLQRHCSSSVKTNGNSGGGTGTAASQLQRNSSKLSQYSSNSCRYLTPQSSLVSQCQPAPVHTMLTLRPNSSCSTIINFGATVKSSSGEADEPPPSPPPQQPVRAARPKLQRGITIVEHIPIDTSSIPKYPTKRSLGLFDMFFRGSKKLQSSCAQGLPTEV